MKRKLTREELVVSLEELQSDEFDPREIMFLDENELVLQIIECAFYYKEEFNNYKNK